MKKALITFAILAGAALPVVHAGSLRIVNQRPVPYVGEIVATNNPSAPSIATAIYAQVTVPANTTVFYPDPTSMVSPYGPGAPPSATGVFIGLKGGLTGIPLDGTVGVAGTYLGYPLFRNNLPAFLITWSQPTPTDAVVTIL